MIQSLYSHLLDPDLYIPDKQVASFVESMNSPETVSNANDLLKKWTATPLDDIVHQIEFLERRSQKGPFKPFFSGWVSKDKNIELVCSAPITAQQVSQLLISGKCMALATASHTCFFVSEIYHIDGSPILKPNVPEDASQGIMIIGSTVGGVILESVVTIENGQYKRIKSKIKRESMDDYPFSHYYEIKDEKEMASIIRQVPKLIDRYPHLTDGQVLCNFCAMFQFLTQSRYR